MYFSKIRQVVIAACCLVSLLCGAGPTFGQEATQEDEAFYVSFHVPGSTGTFPQAINDFASVTGNYLDATSGQHGFVRDLWGKIVKFDPAGSTSTTPTTINLEGTIAGSYTDAKQVQHGFVRYGTGKIKMFDPPGSIQTVAESINASGTIVGYYQTLPLPGNYHSFMRKADGSFITFDPPGCATSFAQGINREGGITGYAQCPAFSPDPVPFLRDPDGTAHAFPIIGWAFSINRKGFAVGYLRGSGQVFLLSPSGTFTQFDIQGDFLGALYPISINAENTITGTCFGGPGCVIKQGFVISPQGKVTSFNPPLEGGAEVNAVPSSINNFGVIAGWYTSRSTPIGPLPQDGFLRVPLPHRGEH